MAVDQLWLYNEALRVCGERKLAGLTEAREPRFLLDDVFGGPVWLSSVLEEGQWAFATRASKFDFSPSVEPPFGYRYAFNKPTDWVRTTGLCSDEFFRVPLNEMADEAGFWFASIQTIYVKYVSSDAEFGGNFAKWPPSFSEFAGADLGVRILPKLKNARVSTADVDAERGRRLIKALSRDAMNGPTKFFPPGGWTSARVGSATARRSLWNGGSVAS